MVKQRAYIHRPMGNGEWIEVEPDRNWIGFGIAFYRRYLFRNGDKTLHVFAHNPVAKYDENGVEKKNYFLGWPDGHWSVFASLQFFAPGILREELDIRDPENEILEGQDSGPIGDYSEKFNGARYRKEMLG